MREVSSIQFRSRAPNAGGRRLRAAWSCWRGGRRCRTRPWWPRRRGRCWGSATRRCARRARWGSASATRGGTPSSSSTPSPAWSVSLHLLPASCTTPCSSDSSIFASVVSLPHNDSPVCCLIKPPVPQRAAAGCALVAASLP